MTVFPPGRVWREIKLTARFRRRDEVFSRDNLSQAEDIARKHLETVVLALFELSKKQREEESK
jgi:hypothetical protein